MKAIEEVLHGWADYEKIREFLKKEKGIIQISGCTYGIRSWQWFWKEDHCYF
mgnify:CR=1 FL=1